MFYYFFRINKLTQNKLYLYQSGTERSLENSEIIFPKYKEATKIAAFGDWSICDDEIRSYNYISKHFKTYDSIIMLGDQAYNLRTQEGTVGNEFLRWIKPITKSLPYMISAGNHENYEQYNDYINRFLMPSKQLNKNLYYSFDINNAHFVSVASDFALYNNVKDLKEKFADWFKKDMSMTTKKWKIVYMHRPMYCSATTRRRCTTEDVKLRNYFEDLFYLYQVDLVVAGHLHNYERSYPIYKGEIDREAIVDKNNYKNPKYPVYLICGSTGNREGHETICKRCLLN